MKTFGQVIVEARKAASLTQKAVAERLRRADGRRVLPPWLNDLEHDRRYPPENPVIATPRTKARVVNPLPSILEHTFRDLNPQLHSAVGSLAECLGRSSRPLLNAAPLPLSSLLLGGCDELNALFLNGSILSHCS
jgi:transcriptional regulator with XRE-family HTH domain